MEHVPDPYARRPWIAALASLFCTGLGQVYAGRLLRGLVFLFLVLLLPPVVALLSALEPSRGILVAITGAPALALLLMLVATFDAWRLARGAPRPFVRRETNRIVFYVLFLLIGVVYTWAAWAHVKARYLEAFKIPTESMAPTLALGDRILVQKRDPLDAVYARGDLVVFLVHEGEGKYFIKRLIGLPGDHLEVTDDGVRIDGKPLARGEPPAAGAGEAPVIEERFGEHSWGVRGKTGSSASRAPVDIVVPEGHVYVLGDNRPASRDSRQMGPIPMGDLVGKAVYVFWPGDTWDRFGVLR